VCSIGFIDERGQSPRVSHWYLLLSISTMLQHLNVVLCLIKKLYLRSELLVPPHGVAVKFMLNIAYFLRALQQIHTVILSTFSVRCCPYVSSIRQFKHPACISQQSEFICLCYERECVPAGFARVTVAFRGETRRNARASYPEAWDGVGRTCA